MKYFLLIACAVAAYAAQPWQKNSDHWSTADAQRVLADSPWAQPATALFPTGDDQPAVVGPLPTVPGTNGPNAATDGKWDGGVGRIPYRGMPSLPITVRWDSA